MEEVLPPQTQEGAGFEPRASVNLRFSLRIVSVGYSRFCRLEEEGHPIRALSVTESADTALIRLICADSELARHTLKTAGFHFMESELLAIVLPKRQSQPLISICSACWRQRSIFTTPTPFFSDLKGPALAIYVDDATLAERLLIRKGFTLIGESDLKKVIAGKPACSRIPTLADSSADAS